MTDEQSPDTDKSRVRTELHAAMLCDALAGGTTLSEICRGLDIARHQVYSWIQEDPEFAKRMEAAREAGYDVIADDALGIADDASRDTIAGKFGPMLDREWVARSKLRVETRLKLLAKWHPKKYGDKLQVESNNVTANVAISDDPVEAARQYESLMKDRT